MLVIGLDDIGNQKHPFVSAEYQPNRPMRNPTRLAIGPWKSAIVADDDRPSVIPMVYAAGALYLASAAFGLPISSGTMATTSFFVASVMVMGAARQGKTALAKDKRALDFIPVSRSPALMFAAVAGTVAVVSGLIGVARQIARILA